MWLAHHFPDSYDRCVVLAGRHVCRRCLVLYPLAFSVMFLTMSVAPASTEADRILMILLPLPAVIEFTLEHLGFIEYRPTRQVLVSMPLAVALGRGFAIYVNHPTSILFWGVVGIYGGLCVCILILRTFVQARQSRQSEDESTG